MQRTFQIAFISFILVYCHIWATVDVVFAASIAGTKHNLSLSGTFPVHSTNETRICIFCHTPHSAIQSGAAGIDYPLWNHNLSSQSYSVPSNALPAWATMKSTPPSVPDGDSRLCLSCHDGTIAIASIKNTALGPISMTGTEPGGEMPAGSSNLGTDLRGHHPVSIAVNNNLLNDKLQQCINFEVSMQLCIPSGSSPVKLRPTLSEYNGPGINIGGYAGGVQCSSCHDPHNDPNPNPVDPNRTVFLRAGNRASSSALCTACHVLCSESCP